MNLDNLVSQLPMILASLALFLWALARVIEAKAKANPAQDAWDTWAPRAQWVSQRYSEAIEWMVASGVTKWTGAEKLAELNRRVREFEQLWEAGKHIEALTTLTGFCVSAKAKIEGAAKATLPFPTLLSTVGKLGTSPVVANIGPDDPAVPSESDGPGRGEVK